VEKTGGGSGCLSPIFVTSATGALTYPHFELRSRAMTEIFQGPGFTQGHIAKSLIYIEASTVLRKEAG
jgi:hypothetical protein